MHQLRRIPKLGVKPMNDRGTPLLRHWQLLERLQRTQIGLTFDQIADEFEYGRRQVQRDLETMMDAGLPIAFEVREHGRKYWRAKADFTQQPELNLSSTEILSLLLSQQMLAPLAGTLFGDGLATGLRKIQTRLPANVMEYFKEFRDVVLVKEAGLSDYSLARQVIDKLTHAISENIELQIVYKAPKDGKSFRDSFWPYRLILNENSLYCIGRLVERDHVRTLKVIRFEHIKLTSKHFPRPRDFHLDEYLNGSFGIVYSGERQKVRVKLTDWAAVTVREQKWHPTQRIIQDNGTSLVVEFELANTVEFQRWVLSYGRHATVLEPVALARELAEELAAARTTYGSP